MKFLRILNTKSILSLRGIIHCESKPELSCPLCIIISSSWASVWVPCASSITCNLYPLGRSTGGWEQQPKGHLLSLCLSKWLDYSLKQCSYCSSPYVFWMRDSDLWVPPALCWAPSPAHGLQAYSWGLRNRFYVVYVNDMVGPVYKCRILFCMWTYILDNIYIFGTNMKK